MTVETLRRKAMSWIDVRTPRDVEKFLGDVFMEQRLPNYGLGVRANLEDHPERSSNPFYIMFYARTILMAAEHGFFEAGEHYKRYKRDPYAEHDFMDPRHLLALACYLATVTLGLREEKDTLRRNASNRHELEHALAFYKIPDNGSYKEKPYFDREELGLGLYVPEFTYHEKVKEINFTSKLAETVQKREFVGKYLPQIQDALSHLQFSKQQTNSIFLNSSVNWNVRR